MLAANVCAADFIARAKHPSLYRVHEGPTPEKRTLLQNYLRALGLGLTIGDDPEPRRVPGRRRRDEGPARRRPDPHDAAALDAAGDLHRHQQRPLRTRVRGLHALHEPDPALSRPVGAPGHQGAAAGQALHAADRPEQPRPGLAQGCRTRHRRAASADEMQWETAGIHCSANERRADEASRDVEAWLKCRYMREHLGEEYGGTVSARHELRPLRDARRPVRRRARPHHRTRRRVLPLRRGAPGTARRAQRRPLLRSDRGCACRSAGSTSMVARSISALSAMARIRRSPHARAATRGGDKTAAAAKELAAVKEADRAVRKASKGRTGGTGSTGRAGRPAKSAAGKSGPRSPVKASGRR